MEYLLKEENIFIMDNLKKKKDVLNFIVEKSHEKNYINDKNSVLQSFLKREKEGETGMGNFIAIPHAINESILKPSVFIILLKKDVKWKSIDNNNKAKYIFALLIPKSKQNQIHLKTLSTIAQKLMEEKNINILETYNINKIFNAFK